jgi:hypothetical protein
MSSRYLELHLEVRSAAPALLLLTHAEHVAERVHSAAASLVLLRVLLQSLFAVDVVHLALLLVRQDVVGIVDLLELLCAGRVARILVRVVLQRQTAERLLNLFLVGFAVDTQNTVVIDFAEHRHRQAGDDEQDLEQATLHFLRMALRLGVRVCRAIQRWCVRVCVVISAAMEIKEWCSDVSKLFRPAG